MADTDSKMFQFDLVSPERVLASEEAVQVVVPGEAGNFGVLAHHMPLLSTLRPGVVEVYNAEGKEPKKIFVAGGFADVADNQCTVLAEEAIAVEDLDAQPVLEQQIQDLTEDLERAGEDQIKATKIEKSIRVIKAKLQAVTGVLVA